MNAAATNNGFSEDTLERDAQRMKDKLKIAMLGDGDIIGTTKKNRVKSRLLAACPKSLS